MSDAGRLTWALGLSLLLHALLLVLGPAFHRPSLDVAVPPLLDVDVLPAPAPASKPRAVVPPPAPPHVAAAAQPAAPPPVVLPDRQIVSPPEYGEEKPPEKTRLLSDRDNTVKEETVKRGDPAPGDPDAKTRRVAPKDEPRPEPPRLAAAPKPRVAAVPNPPPAPRPPRPARAAESAALPKLDQLLPQPGDFAREPVNGPEASAPRAAPEQQAAISRNDLLRYGDPWRRGGLAGATLDFLPQIREGDITMLNTKAEQFAPFVRRVAVRVFENFRINLRRSVDGGRFDSSQEYASVEAVMDRQGRLVSMDVRDRSQSGGLGTDRNLQSAVREGFFDRNPPSGAEALDGNIHFLFDANVALSLEPGRGLVGYRALFRAGLQ